MKNHLNKRVKRLDIWDIFLIKLSIAAAVLIILKIWPTAITWVKNIDVTWVIIAFIIFGIRPFTKYLK